MDPLTHPSAAETPFNLKKTLIFETKEDKRLIFEPNAVARYFGFSSFSSFLFLLFLLFFNSMSICSPRHLLKATEPTDPLERALVNQWLEIEEQITLIDSDALPFDVLLAKLKPVVGPQGTLVSGKVFIPLTFLCVRSTWNPQFTSSSSLLFFFV